MENFHWHGTALCGFLPVPNVEVGYSIQYSKPGADPFGDVTALLQAVDLNWRQEVPKLLGVFDGHFDGPAGGVALHDLAGGGVRLGGDQGEVVTAAGLGLAHQHHGDRLRSEHRVPQAVDRGGVNGAVGSVAVP